MNMIVVMRQIVSIVIKIIRLMIEQFISLHEITMKAPSESLPLPTPEQQSPSPALRKLSLLHQSGLDWQQSLQLTDLKKLGNYISSNIQSQRKSILQLYSSSFYTLHKNEHSLLPELNLNVTSRTLKRKSNRDNAEVNSPHKPNLSQEVNDRDFIVSNNFPNKLLKTTEKIRIEPPVRAASPERIVKKKEVCHTPTLRNVEAKMERTIPMVTREIRKKLPKLLKSRSNEPEQNQLNPWEYLKIQDQPIFNIFI